MAISAINQTLERQNHQLKIQLEALHHINDNATVRCKELTEALEDEHLNML